MPINLGSAHTEQARQGLWHEPAEVMAAQMRTGHACKQ